MNLINTPSRGLPISYAGITAECIPGTQDIYEVVWNCGSLAGLMITLENPSSRDRAMMLLTEILESAQRVNPEIIFILDAGILGSQRQLLDMLFTTIFGVGNFVLLGVLTTSQDINSVNGLRVNRSGFEDTSALIDAIHSLPKATVLSSIPKSDPRIDEINTLLDTSKLLDTSAAKSLQLLSLNARKSNQIKIAGESIGFLGLASNPEELEEIFSRIGNERLVVKEDSGSAGGTSVNFLGNKEQKISFLKNAKIFPLLVFRFLSPSLVESTSGLGRFPLQFRPFLTRMGIYAGGCLKIPNEPIQGDGFSVGGGKGSFARQNRTLNTSSGLCNSFFFDALGRPVSGQVIGEGGFRTLDEDGVTQFLDGFRFVKGGKSISGDTILSLTESAFPLVRSIQLKTNLTLGLI